MDDPKLTLREWLGFKERFQLENARTLGHVVGFGVIFIALILALALFVALGRIVIEVLSFGDTSNETEGVSIRDLGYVVLGVVGVPFAAWRTLVAQRQAKTAEQSHITDQISKAVEQLGTTRETVITGDNNEPVNETVPNIEVRIGGLLALERIKNNSPDDHIQVMEILCAYIRENMKDYVNSLSISADSEPKELREDLKTSYTIISRRNENDQKLEATKLEYGSDGYLLDLRGIKYTGLILSDINFTCADMHGSEFEHTKCTRIFFNNAKLGQSKFCNSRLFICKFHDAKCSFCLFSETRMIQTEFDRAELSHSEWRGNPDYLRVKFNQAYVTGADFTKLSGTAHESIKFELATAFGISSALGDEINDCTKTNLSKDPAHWPAWTFEDQEHSSLPNPWEEYQEWLKKGDAYIPPQLRDKQQTK